MPVRCSTAIVSAETTSKSVVCDGRIKVRGRAVVNIVEREPNWARHWHQRFPATKVGTLRGVVPGYRPLAASTDVYQYRSGLTVEVQRSRCGSEIGHIHGEWIEHPIRSCGKGRSRQLLNRVREVSATERQGFVARTSYEIGGEGGIRTSVPF